ncbi:MAG: putative nitrogen fixation protein NifT [Gammaproteobacteria bacterium]|jgi:nitrogen fixation protein NifT
MPKVMLRRGQDGGMTMYVAKKDLEETVVSLQHEGPEQWGGEVELADGSRYFVDLMDQVPNLPITVRARRL